MGVLRTNVSGGGTILELEDLLNHKVDLTELSPTVGIGNFNGYSSNIKIAGNVAQPGKVITLIIYEGIRAASNKTAKGICGIYDKQGNLLQEIFNFTRPYTSSSSLQKHVALKFPMTQDFDVMIKPTSTDAMYGNYFTLACIENI